jgi:hypothetical protein
MTSNSGSGRATLRHDILEGILCCAITHAEVASALEPTLRRLPGMVNGICQGALDDCWRAAGRSAEHFVKVARSDLDQVLFCGWGVGEGLRWV